MLKRDFAEGIEWEKVVFFTIFIWFLMISGTWSIKPFKGYDKKLYFISK